MPGRSMATVFGCTCQLNYKTRPQESQAVCREVGRPGPQLHSIAFCIRRFEIVRDEKFIFPLDILQDTYYNKQV